MKKNYIIKLLILFTMIIISNSFYTRATSSDETIAKTSVGGTSGKFKNVLNDSEHSISKNTYRSPSFKEIDGINYMLISSDSDLVYFRDMVNSGNQTLNGRLMADIDLSKVCYKKDETTNGKNWTPIGTQRIVYTGIFDGNGKTVKNLYIDIFNMIQGLFGYIRGADSCIKNLTVEGEIICRNDKNIGGIVGIVEGARVDNCINKCNIIGYDYVGGIAGFTYDKSVIANCINEGKIIGNGESVGGIVGKNMGNINNCINKSSIQGPYKTSIGGITGSIEIGDITNCINEGNITGSGASGGICGELIYGSIINCLSRSSSISSVNGAFHSASYPARSGAIVGVNNSQIITNCYYSKDLTIIENKENSPEVVGVRSIGTKTSSILQTTDVDGVTSGKTTVEIASGEVARLLNGNKADGIYGQMLKSDAAPVFMLPDKSNMVLRASYNHNGSMFY